MRRWLTIAALSVGVWAVGATAQADVVWPALYLEARILSWYAITIGLGAEWVVLVTCLKMPPRRALVVDLAMNAASTAIGVLLIPLSGLVLEFFPGLAVQRLFNVGTFNVVTWAATFAAAVLVTALIEWLIVYFIFKYPDPMKAFRWLVVANCASVAVAFVSLLIKAPEP